MHIVTYVIECTSSLVFVVICFLNFFFSLSLDCSCVCSSATSCTGKKRCLNFCTLTTTELGDILWKTAELLYIVHNDMYEHTLQEMMQGNTTTQQKGKATQHNSPETVEKLAASGGIQTHNHQFCRQCSYHKDKTERRSKTTQFNQNSHFQRKIGCPGWDLNP